jgi:hypothetical protein
MVEPGCWLTDCAARVLRCRMTRSPGCGADSGFRSSADSWLLSHGRAPASISAWRTHLRIVSTVPTPSWASTDVITAHSES